MNITHLECALCGTRHEAQRLHNVCEKCGRPLYPRYDLKEAGKTLTKESLRDRRSSMWRYREVMPVRDDVNIVTLDEGWTPLLDAPRLARRAADGSGIEVELLIKDESQNPTGSFKARGMAAAVSMAKELGATRLAVPTAGNAGGALAAYSARAGLAAFIFMPKDTPRACIVECRETGADVTLVDGLITDCAAEIAKRKDAEGWFDVSTLKEPYRVEGKKTLGYELAEQLGWTLPDVVIYPTGGGTGLVGMWKAFDEMEQLGWIDSRRPRMFSVQAAGCAPMVRAFEQGERFAEEWQDAHTTASGLRVPRAVGDFLILDALRESNGGAIAVTDDEMIRASRVMGSSEGLFVAPEGGACYAALERLMKEKLITNGARVVLFNTGAGVKYLESFG